MGKLLSFLWRFKFIIYIIALIGIGFSIGALEATMDSKFCGACHEMDHVYNAWSHSSHANSDDEHMRAGCMDCHAKPGLKGLLAAKFGNGSKSAYYHVVYMFHTDKEKIYQKIITEHAHAPHEACLKCHTKFQETDRAKSISFPHHSKDTEFRDEMCSKCHQYVVHSHKKDVSYEPPRKNEICLNCHKKEGVEIDSCESCHAGQGEMAEGKGAKDIKGSQDSMKAADVGCKECHTNYKTNDYKVVVQSCVDCHDGDESYGKPAIEEMQSELKAKLPLLSKELIELAEEIKLARRNGKNIDQALKLYDKIKFNYNFLYDDKSFGVHNHEYSMSILGAIEKDITSLRSSIK